MTTCREIEGLLSPYLDRELDPLVARRVEQHVASCTACSDALVAMREAGRVLAAAIPLRSQAEWEALALRVEMAIDREEARVFQEEAERQLAMQDTAAMQDAADMQEAEPALAMRSARMSSMDIMEDRATGQPEAPRQRARGLGWWAYGSGAIATAMLVLLLWPRFKERVEDGPPDPGARTTFMDQDVAREDVAREDAGGGPASDAVREPATPAPGETSIGQRKIESSPERVPPTGADQGASPAAPGALRAQEISGMESTAKKQLAAEGSTGQTGEAPSLSGKASANDASREQFAEKSTSSDEHAELQKSRANESGQSVPEAAPAEEDRSATKERASVPQPMSKESEPSAVWRSEVPSNGFRVRSKSMSGPPASDTPPPPIKLISETELAQMSEFQTHEALKAGTEKSLSEATHVLETFLNEYPRSVFRPRASANLVRTTAALVQLNPNLWCERAVAALENWKLEKTRPGMNVEAEVSTIEGRCLK